MGEEDTRQLLRKIRQGAVTQEGAVEGWVRESRHLGPEARMDAMREMVREDFWFWIPVVCRILEDELGTTLFMPMIGILSRRVEPTLAGEIYWSGLINGGERRPGEAIDRALEIMEGDEEIAAVFASSLLAGAARVVPTRVMEVLEPLLSSPRPVPRSTFLRTANIALNEGTLSGERVLDIVLSHPIPREEMVRSSYSLTLRLLHPLNRDATESRLRELLRSSSPRLRDQVARDISVLDRISVDTRLLLDEHTGDQASQGTGADRTSPR